MRHSETLLPKARETGKFSWEGWCPNLECDDLSPLCSAAEETKRRRVGALHITSAILPLNRAFVLSGPPILSKLNQIERECEKQQNVNRAAFMQHKLEHKPKK